MGDPRRPRSQPSRNCRRLLRPYDAPRNTDNAKLPTGARDNPNAPTFSAFVWPVSDVIMSLLNAGLHLDHFSEAPSPEIYPGLGPTATQLPATYTLKAAKPSRNVSHETSPQVPK